MSKTYHSIRNINSIFIAIKNGNNKINDNQIKSFTLYEAIELLKANACE